jgi:energy-coupling factor transport system substrate-specific component
VGTLLVTAIIIITIIHFERRKVSAKEIALIAGLSAIAGLGRIPFAGIPNVQPTTFIVIVSGYVLGPRAGFMVGAVSALASNFFLGQGPWTPWQMLVWGMAGASGGFASKFIPNISRLQMVILCGVWGYFYGWFINLWYWSAYTYPHTLGSYIAVCATSFVFDTLHASGNVVLSWMLGKEFINIISRFKRKMTISYLEVKEEAN